MPWPKPQDYPDSQSNWKAFRIHIRTQMDSEGITHKDLWEEFHKNHGYTGKQEAFDQQLKDITHGRGPLQNPIFLELLLRRFRYPAAKLFGQDLELLNPGALDQLTKVLSATVRQSVTQSFKVYKTPKRYFAPRMFEMWLTSTWEVLSLSSYIKGQQGDLLSNAVITMFMYYSSKKTSVFPHGSDEFKAVDDLIYQWANFTRGVFPDYDRAFTLALLHNYLAWTFHGYLKTLTRTTKSLFPQEKGSSDSLKQIGDFADALQFSAIRISQALLAMHPARTTELDAGRIEHLFDRLSTTIPKIMFDRMADFTPELKIQEDHRSMFFKIFCDKTIRVECKWRIDLTPEYLQYLSELQDAEKILANHLEQCVRSHEQAQQQELEAAEKERIQRFNQNFMMAWILHMNSNTNASN